MQQELAVVAGMVPGVDSQMLLCMPANATVLVEVVVVKDEAVVKNASLFAAVVAQIPCLLSSAIEEEEVVAVVVVKVEVIKKPLVVLSKVSRHHL